MPSNQQSQHRDVIIVGGGAAGLMCAATAAKRGRSVLVLDHANRVGKKILMSGGGRCNFTNYYVEPTNYLGENEHFCKSALSRFTQWDFIALVDSYQLAYHEKTQGQLFCDNKAIDILYILLEECRQHGAEIRTSCDIHSTTHDTHYQLDTSMGRFSCESLVIATGGLSIPTMGATGLGYELAEQFNLRITEKQASLVPFTLSDKYLEKCKALAGVSVEVNVNNNRQSFTDMLLFTHRGISGPAILQISNYWNNGESVEINFYPGLDLLEQLKTWRSSGQKAELKTLLSRIDNYDIAKNFIQTWLAELADITLSNCSDEQLKDIADLLQRWQCKPSGTEGWRTAEVTRGGVNTDDVSSKTFEAKHQAGLYLVGEVLDVTGWLGGFNFQWAWASGWCAGQYV